MFALPWPWAHTTCTEPPITCSVTPPCVQLIHSAACIVAPIPTHRIGCGGAVRLLWCALLWRLGGWRACPCLPGMAICWWGRWAAPFFLLLCAAAAHGRPWSPRSRFSAATSEGLQVGVRISRLGSSGDYALLHLLVQDISDVGGRRRLVVVQVPIGHQAPSLIPWGHMCAWRKESRGGCACMGACVQVRMCAHAQEGEMATIGQPCQVLALQ